MNTSFTFYTKNYWRSKAVPSDNDPALELGATHEGDGEIRLGLVAGTTAGFGLHMTMTPEQARSLAQWILNTTASAMGA